MKRRYHILKVIFLAWCYSVTLLGSFVFGIFTYIFYNHSIDFARLERYSSGRPSILLDETGCEWGRFQLDKREPIAIQDMPAHVINAFVAAEDRHFFKHHGISWRGVLRSIWVNCMHGRRAQGASTITQQLVRLLFLGAEKTFVRKIKEQIYALLVEQQFSKEHILQMYLNHIYFGCGMYGIEAASQRFWNKSATALNIDESATLAAIICAPNRYCPLIAPAASQRRRDIILGSMHKCGFITKEEYTATIAKPVIIMPGEKNSCAPHFKELLRMQLEGIVGKKALYTDGLVIQTTLNRSMQQVAEFSFKNRVAALRAKNNKPFDGGMVAIDTVTGSIKAYVGGYDFSSSKFDRVRSAQRQIGSTFKVLIYAAAIKLGKKFTDTAVDEPLSLLQSDGTFWSPLNDSRDFKGQVTLAYALYRSNNIVAIKTLCETGINAVIDLAQQCHLVRSAQPYPSLALGCIDTTLLSVVRMFNIFANTGLYVEPYSLVWIKDCWGNKIWKRTIQQPVRILDTRTAGQMTKALTLGMKRLRIMRPIQWSGVDVISKTGTTNDFRTCWFIGATPTVTTGIYIGCDDNRSMGKNMYPIHTAFPIWLDFNSAIKHHRTQFICDPTLKEIIVHERTGTILSNDRHPSAIRVAI